LQILNLQGLCVCCSLDDTRTSFPNPMFYGSYSHTAIFNSPIKVPKSNEQGVKSLSPAL